VALPITKCKRYLSLLNYSLGGRLNTEDDYCCTHYVIPVFHFGICLFLTSFIYTKPWDGRQNNYFLVYLLVDKHSSFLHFGYFYISPIGPDFRLHVKAKHLSLSSALFRLHTVLRTVLQIKWKLGSQGIRNNCYITANRYMIPNAQLKVHSP
jgi:hypothetical protein